MGDGFSSLQVRRNLIAKLFFVYLLYVFLRSGLAVVYTLRVNISVAAQKMRDELGWTESQKGLVLVCFSKICNLNGVSNMLRACLVRLLLGVLCGSDSCVTSDPTLRSEMDLRAQHLDSVSVDVVRSRR